MSFSKELPKCFVCFQPTEKFGETENTFLSVVMLLRMEGHLPYPPEGSPVLIRDWDPCEPCVPKTLDLYKKYAKLQERRRRQSFAKKVRERQEKADDGINGKVRRNMHQVANNFEEPSEVNRCCTDPDPCLTSEEEEASPKNKIRRTTNNKGKKPFKCPKCPSSFTRKDSITRHIKLVHEKIRPFKCPKCPSSLRKDSMTRHIRLVHEKIRPFKCPKCTSKFFRKYHLQRHTNSVHWNGLVDWSFKCPHCVKSFSTSKSLRVHVAIVHDGRVLYKCPQPKCKTTFVNKCSISRHVAEVHEKRRDFKCPVCLKGFFRKSDCAAHEREVHKTMKIIEIN